jgi:hypothetical protein
MQAGRKSQKREAQQAEYSHHDVRILTLALTVAESCAKKCAGAKLGLK